MTPPLPPRPPSLRKLAGGLPGSTATVFLLLTFAAVLSAAGPDSGPPSREQIEHTLTIVHPGDATAAPMPHTLVETRDEEGEPAAYSMWVDSVICREKVCDVVKVQLHWDALGRYQRFEVAYGSQLTKLDHVPFTPGDLAKLQSILRDPESPLKEVEKESMTGQKPEKSGKLPAGVDGVTGATILTLKTAVVIGAGYTCYDLWHWSNGLLANHIRDFTGRGSSREKLHAWLASEDTDSALLALEYFRKRNVIDRETRDAVVAKAVKGKDALMKPALAYLEETTLTGQVRAQSILELFAASGSRKRLLILEALASEKKPPIPGFYDRLCEHLPALETYYEVHLFLDLMEKRNPASAVVAAKAAELLDHEKFFISRRAWQYLEKQTLPADLRKRVDAYHEENRQRL